MNQKQTYPYRDPNQFTQPLILHDPSSQTKPNRIQPQTHSGPPQPSPRKRRGGCLAGVGCLLLILLVPLLAYFLAPLRTNLLLMGTDRTSGTEIGRTDTLMLITVVPLQPYVGMLSIPRDLWIAIPGHGENRINTAHFFAELDNPGSGPSVTRQVVEDNFQVSVPYYVRVRFDGFKDVVDAMGGITITLDKPASGFEAGVHHLDGAQALAFARERKSSDDFFRMAHGQLLLKAALKQMLVPQSWTRLPAVYQAAMSYIDTNIPLWQWPRLGLALLRAGSNGIDNRTISRDQVQPFITDGGADVLQPEWDKILPVVREMFGG